MEQRMSATEDKLKEFIDQKQQDQPVSSEEGNS